MKAKINIELWDDSTMSDIEEACVTTKFLETCYKLGYEHFTKGLCKQADGMKYTVSVEVVDNTAE